MKGNRQVVIFLLMAFFGCNNLVIAQQPPNDFCANAQELCPNQFAFASTNQATTDTCQTCSDFGVFNSIFPQATIWYVFKTNSNGDSVAVSIDVTSIPFGVEVGGALQLRILKQVNACDPSGYEFVNSSVSSTNSDTLFYYGGLLPNTYYSLVFNENTTGVADPGIEFFVKVAGEAVVHETPSAILTYSDTVCLNETTLFSLQLNNCPNATLINWFINDVLMNTSNELVFESSALSDSDVVRVETTCYSPCSESISVVTNPIYVHSFSVSAGNDTIIDPGEIAQLHASTTAELFYWDTQLFLSNSTILEPFAYPDQTFTYPFLAIDAGCSLYDYVTVFVRTDMDIPNTFSPNNDGVNDTWKIPSIDLYPKNKLTILNRNGSKVSDFSPYSPANEWTGTWNGAALPEGVYFYVLELNDEKNKILKGTITLIR
jgi:gliding motility-associated-like protein